MPSKPITTIVFTSFEDEQTTHDKLIKAGASWYLYGKETCPTTNKVHLQGMAYTKVKQCWQQKLKPMHIEQCMDPLKSIEYCSKDGKVTEFGVRPTWNIKGQKQKNMKELLALGEEQRLEELNPHQYLTLHKAEIIAKSKQYTPPKLPRTCLWIYGDTGVGKSRYVNTHYPGAYVKQQNKWWDMYENQKVVHLEDLDMNGSCLSHHLKLWADPWTPEIKGEIKCGMIPLGYDTFIVTSQYTIGQIFDGDAAVREAIDRRFTFINFNEKPPIFD